MRAAANRNFSLLALALLLPWFSGCNIAMNRGEEGGRKSTDGMITAVLACETGGKSIDGGCVYLGQAGQSCTAACKDHGGTAAALDAKLGNKGSLEFCSQAAALFGFHEQGVDPAYSHQGPGAAGGLGCAVRTDGSKYVYDVAFPTLPNTSDPVSRRLCACTR